MPDRSLRITLTIQPEDPTRPFDVTEIPAQAREAIKTIIQQATQQIAKAIDDPIFARQVLVTRE